MEPTAQALTKFETISLDEAGKRARQLQTFLSTNKLIVDIAGKKYVPVEGWQFCGAASGLTQIVTECAPVAPDQDEKEIRYRAVVEIINQNGTVVSRGYAWCSNKEAKKRSFDEYAIASMAQTRAIGKAYRNILSWIVKMAGYEATPAEEMDKDQAETDLAKAKQRVLKAFTEKGIKESAEMMTLIEDALGRRTIETIDDAEQVIQALDKD